jgi:hypothetical protein
MPLGRKHLRRNRDAPNVGWTIQRTASNLSRRRREVNVPKELDAGGWAGEAAYVPLYARKWCNFSISDDMICAALKGVP